MVKPKQSLFEFCKSEGNTDSDKTQIINSPPRSPKSVWYSSDSLTPVCLEGGFY